MKRSFRTMATLAILLGSLVGCGAGSHSPLPGPGAEQVNTVTGVAATGSPVFGMITLKDSSSPAVELTTSTASDGTFAFNTDNLVAPFILKTASGGKTLYSVAIDGNGVTNINPLTTIVVSAAAGGADLDALYAAGAPSALATLALNLPGAETAVQTALAPVFSQFGVSGNIINSTYVADHTGADAILDVIDVSVSAGTIRLTNKANAAVILTTPASAIGNAAAAVANIPPVPVPSLGATLYRSNCSRCHGDIFTSSLIGRSTPVKILGAIASDFGGMSALSALTPEEIQAISDAIPAQAPPPPAPGTPNGTALYSSQCASCHGGLAVSTKLGVSFVRIQNAISTNTGNMGRLSSLSSAELQAIVDVLNPAPTTPIPPTTPTLDGATIYADNCAGCHGALAVSTKKGLTVTRFYSAVTSSFTGMAYLSKLSVAELQALISVLPPAIPDPGTPPGQPLYETLCSGCHGALASSTKGGATAARIQGAIANNTGNMGSLASLTTAQIADIVTSLAAVAPPPTPVTGAELYALNCAGCHGALASSAKGGATALRIQTAIANNTGSMGTFSTLTAAQIADIANALAAIPPPVAPPTGAGLYTANCAGCHGPLATTTKGGVTAAKIQASINSNLGGMGYLSTQLDAAQIALIEAELALHAAPACGSCHAVTLANIATGRHRLHTTAPSGSILAGFLATTSCSICHGAGYTTTTNVAATHNNGTVDINVANIRWVAPIRSANGTVTTRGTCTPACHGRESW
ncbi:MAG: c-type cytochrome [Sideroxyarcus sp.]|nr:c-type cytochrome [Sideroxyarcus sp.]